MGQFRLCNIATNQVLVAEEVEGRDLYVVISGLLKVEVGGEQTDIKQPGDWFGELSLLYDAPNDATITAIEPSTVCILGRKEVGEFPLPRGATF